MNRTRSLVLLGALVLAFSSLTAAQTSSGRALTIEDIYRIQSVGNPQISPDGLWVVHTVSTPIEEGNRTHTGTWIVSSDRSAPARRLLHYGRDISSFRWTADNRLQYEADGTWTMDPQNPSAPPAQSTALARGAVPSPDGVWIAATKAIPRPNQEAVFANDFEKRHQERFKGKIFDWKDFQRDGAPFPSPDPTARPALQIVITPSGGGEGRVLADLDLRPSNLAWHPNGKLLLFIADSHWRDGLTYGRSDLWTVTVDRQVARLTDDPYTYGDAHFSPDGKHISCVRRFGTDMVIQEELNHGGPSDLFIRPASGGKGVNLTADWDLEPRGTAWSPDSRFIYFTAGIGGATHLFRVGVQGGGVEQITHGERRIGRISIDESYRKMAYTVGIHHEPPEVYVADIDGTNEQKLTEVHRSILAEIEFSGAERLRFPSYDGTEIEGWIMFPYGYDSRKGPYPMIVTSHGGPHSATGYSFNFKKQFFAANGYFVLDTNFRSSTGYGESFKWATWGEWGNKDGQDVMSGVDYVLKRYPIDPKRVGHTGHSYGGFMTNWVITQYPDRFAAAVTGAGISNWISDYGTADIYRTKETEFFGPPWDPAARERLIKQSPLTHAGRVRTPTLFVHGEVDHRVPYDEAEQMYFALQRRGIPSKMIIYEGQSHGIRGHWNNVHRMINELAWWEKYLK